MRQKILIVDDQQEILELLEATFIAGDYEILLAKNGTEALEIVRQQMPDLILLDVMMPETNGFEICRQLKSNPDTEHIIIVLISSLGQKRDIEIGSSAGADAYITKPFSPIALINRIEHLVFQRAKNKKK